MYYKIIKKYYLYKIFSLSLPSKKNSNQPCYLLCKYFSQKIPCLNISLLIKELQKLLSLSMHSLPAKRLLFFCAEKVFFLNSIFLQQKQLTYIEYKNLSLVEKKCIIKKIVFVIFYNLNITNVIAAFFKDQKIPSIGFLDFHNQPKIADYTIAFEIKSFASLFLFHFILKKNIAKC